MKATTKSRLLMTVASASVVSACAPNPTVLTERVYGNVPSTSIATPRYDPPLENRYVQTRPPIDSVSVHQPSNTPRTTVRTIPLPVDQPLKVEKISPPKTEITAPKIETTNEIETPIVEEDSKTEPREKRTYTTSGAVQALMKQSDTEATQGKLDTAIATMERALRIEGDNPDIWFKLARLHERQGDKRQAMNMLDKAKYYQELLN